MTIEEHIAQFRFTILLGKNGSGKSTKLRELDRSDTINSKYISPERGGTLKYNPNVDNNIANNASWLKETRSKNRFEQFREQSAAQFRNLEMLILREIEQNHEKRKNLEYKFDDVLKSINDLLPAIQVVRADKGFSISSKAGLPINEDSISSGESELIALAIEVLVYSRSDEKNRVLLLDEPDVHLHPDLQGRFVKFIEEIATVKDMRVVIATHSTAIIGGFSDGADLGIVPIVSKDQQEFSPFKKARVSNEIIPIFGVHPLSSAFNQTPVVLVEGDDDKRVIEQAVRSSEGRLKLYPCSVGSVQELAQWEEWLNSMLPAIYDSPRAFSLRDLDDSQQQEIDNLGLVIRCRLNCYSIENLLLTDECFHAHRTTAKDFFVKLRKWIAQFHDHKYAAEIQTLADNFENRRRIKIKNIRNILLSLLETNKPWEVVVGQLLSENLDASDFSENTLNNYLGTKTKNEAFS